MPYKIDLNSGSVSLDQALCAEGGINNVRESAT